MIDTCAASWPPSGRCYSLIWTFARVSCTVALRVLVDSGLLCRSAQCHEVVHIRTEESLYVKNCLREHSAGQGARTARSLTNASPDVGGWILDIITTFGSGPPPDLT